MIILRLPHLSNRNAKFIDEVNMGNLKSAVVSSSCRQNRKSCLFHGWLHGTILRHVQHDYFCSFDQSNFLICSVFVAIDVDAAGAPRFTLSYTSPCFSRSSEARLSKVPKTFRTRKAIRKTPPRLFCEAGLFICCKGDKNLNNHKVSCPEMPLFWRYKENYVTQNAAEKLRGLRVTSSRLAGVRCVRDACGRLLSAREAQKPRKAIAECSSSSLVLSNRPLKLVCFVFPVQTTWCPHGNFPFVFSLVMRTFARA